MDRGLDVVVCLDGVAEECGAERGWVGVLWAVLGEYCDSFLEEKVFLTVARGALGRVLYCDLVARAGKELLPWCRVCVPLWVFGPEVWGKPKGVSTVGQVFRCCLADVVAEVFRGVALESPVGS